LNILAFSFKCYRSWR